MAGREPIAIVGMGCRFPGADDPDAFFELLREGREGVREIPRSRWDLDEIWDADPARPGKIITRRAGLLESVDGFDWRAFEVSPREARFMDPQHRLMLEVAWEALEDAGLPRERVAGTRAGVYVGVKWNDYAKLQAPDLERQEGYCISGFPLCFAANRISYFFDLRGPSFIIDVSCSSSLVALHLACQSLWSGESELALAGGVNLILALDTFVAASKAGVLSADGRCKAFDASADGFARGEGAGLVVLKPLSRARADGDRVYAVVRGTAANHNGRTEWIMAPSRAEQETLVRDALRSAGVDGRDVDYVELHGPGTRKGDPIEAGALGAVVGAGRDGEPCRVGSVKTNLGHLESAAGVAGVIKTALAMWHRELPPSLHLSELNPEIDLAALGLAVQTETTPWPTRGDGKRAPIAGVSGLSLGGGNAHAILAGGDVARALGDGDRGGDRVHLLPLSARSDGALRDRARALAAALRDRPPALADLLHTAGARRSHLEHRLAVVGKDVAELAGALDQWAATAPPSRRNASAARVAFVFGGQGPLSFAVARELYATEPAFREALDACARAAAGELHDLVAALHADEAHTRMGDPTVAQPALCALQIALAALWRAWGVAPSAIVGHSLGEVAAAHVAGALSLDDAMRIAAARGRLIAELAPPSRMAQIALAPDALAPRLASADVALAAENGPATCVVSGAPDAVAAFVTALGGEGTDARLLGGVSYASHIPAMAPVADALGAALADVRALPPSLPLYSTVTGARVVDGSLDGAYWAMQLTRAVRFLPALDAILADGATVFVEIGAQPTLGGAIGDTLAARGVDGIALPSLRRNVEDRRVALGTLGALYERGVTPAWERVSPSGRVATLPTYPWQRERMWLDPPRAVPSTEGAHPLLGAHQALAFPEGAHLFETTIDRARLPWVDDHRVGGVPVVPAAAYVEMALAASEVLGLGPRAIADLELLRALVLDGDGARRLQLHVHLDGDAASLRVHSRAEGSRDPWTLHATARLVPALGLDAHDADRTPLDGESLDAAGTYREFSARAVDYGPAFRGVERLERRDGEVLAHVRPPSTIGGHGGEAGYRFHPAILDACMHSLVLATPARGDSGFMPVRIARLEIAGAPARGMWARSRQRGQPGDADHPVADLRVVDEAGRPIVVAEGIALAWLDRPTLRAAAAEERWCYAVEWERAASLGSARPVGKLLLWAEHHDVAAVIARAHDAVLVGDLEELRRALQSRDFAAVVHLASLADPPVDALDAARLDEAVARGVDAAREMARALSGTGVPLWLVTRGAQAIGDHAVDAAGAMLWGYGRAIAEEQPGEWGGLVDLDPDASVEAQARALLREIAGASSSDEREVALRGGERRVPRLMRRALPSPRRALGLRADASYLVTGGLGGLGLAVARWLVDGGARHVVLASRNAEPRDPRTRAILDELARTGATLERVAVDCARWDEVTALVARLPRLAGVVHAAGVAEHRPAVETSAEELRATLGAKVWGAAALDRALAARPGGAIDFFALFSSGAAILRSPWMAGYAAANAFLDGIAHARRRRGETALSIDWGLWAEVGLVEKWGPIDLRGQGAIPPATGVALLERMIRGDATHVAVLPIDWAEWRRAYPTYGGGALLRRLEATPAATTSTAAPVEPPPPPLGELAPDERAVRLVAYLRDRAARVLRCAESAIDPTRALVQHGLDSLLALELRNRVERELSLRVKVMDLLGGRSLVEVAADLAARVVAAPSLEAKPTPDRPSENAPSEPFPLTPLQQAYLLGEGRHFELGGIRGHFYIEIDFDALDEARLERAWRRIVERHEMLRAIVLPDGRQQLLAHLPEWSIAVEDLGGESPAAATARLAAVRDEMERLGPATDRWPLFELRAVRVPGGAARLHLSLAIILVDGASLGILLRELERLYREPDAPLAPPAVSARARVIDRATRSDETPERREAWAFWRQRLPSLPPAPELPLARDPSTLGTTRLLHHTATLGAPAWRRFRERAAAVGVTPTVALCAAYASVLARWATSPHFTLNLLRFDRTADMSDVVGPFSATLMLEVDVRAGDGFAALAKRIGERLAADLEHVAVGGVEVLRELARHHGASAKPAMPVVFASLLGVAAQGLDVFPAAWERRRAHSMVQTPQVWIDHQVYEQSGALVLNWDAVDAIFPDGMVSDMFGAYAALVEALAADGTEWDAPPEIALPAAQAERRARVNATQAPLAETTLPSLFLAEAARRPDDAAVITSRRTLSYGELARRAASVASRLVAEKLAPETLVPVVMERGWEQVPATLGAMLAGGAYVPIEAGHPRERLHQLLADTGARVALTHSHVRDRVSWPAGIVPIAVDELAPCDLAAVASRAQPDRLAYVIYTSGSTGKPKGVMLEHRAAVNTLLDVNARFSVGPRDRMLALSSLSFDLSVYDLFGLLAAGGAVVMPDAARERDPVHWLDLIRRARVTLWSSVPAMMDMLVEHLAGREAPRLPLRLAMLSGDWIPVALPDRVKRIADGIAVVSLGGATEASVWSILYAIEHTDAAWRSVPYGTPMVNQRFHVLDGGFAPRPDWVPGQLYIAGDGLARGYFGDAERTRERFFPHPTTGERLYKTGDLGRYLPDGNIEFLGREDFQVKLRGYRIELGEIESALGQHAAVREAVVVARGSGTERRLVAYVVSDPSALRMRYRALTRVAIGAVEVPVETENLSPRGAALVGLPPEAVVGAPVRLRLELADEERWIEGRVAWRNGDRGGVTLLPTPTESALLRLTMECTEEEMPGHAQASQARLPLREPCEARRGDETVTLSAAELSEGGIGADGVPDAWQPGDPVHLGLPLPGVARAELAGTIASRRGARAWIRFELSSEERELVTRRVEQLRRLHRCLRAELRRFLAERLPDYMIPSAFVLLDALPLSANGKVDRTALPATEDVRATPREHEPPRGELEEQLAAMWRDLLGVRTLGRRDNFFDLGGQSLVAVRLLARMREKLGVDLPLRALLEGPTVAELAERLARSPRGRSSLVAIQPEGTRTPLALVHPSGGHVLCYAELARRLGRTQPVYGFAAAGLDGDEEPLTTVEEMAARYVAELRAAVPGPYSVGGWSSGGVIAFEMAQQLAAAGETVAHVILLDSFAPALYPAASDVELADAFARDLLAGHTDGLAVAGDGEAHDADARLARWLDAAVRAGRLPSDVDRARLGQAFRVFRANLRAVARYAPRRWEGELQLVRARRELYAANEPELGWRRLAARVDVRVIDGDHYTLLTTPHVIEVAAELHAKLGTDGADASASLRLPA